MSQRYDQSTVVRPQNTMEAWAKSGKPCGGTPAVYAIRIKFVTDQAQRGVYGRPY